MLVLVPEAWCSAHADAGRKQADNRRGSAAARGYDWAWSRLRASVLSRSPLCVMCQAQGRVTVANEVDHIVPIRLAPERRLDESNLQTLCKPCHSTKTAREDAGFGNDRGRVGSWG